MTNDERYKNQCELVKRIARIATKIVPDEFAGVELRFINDSSSSYIAHEDAVHQAMEKVKPRSGTPIGTSLRNKILEPLVYNAISTTPVSFKRPLLVCVITDGCPYGEPEDKFKKAIIECKQKLVAAQYEPRAVMFCISQIGADPGAMRFLDGLRTETQIEDVIYCTADLLDSKFRELKEQERVLESWLLDLLTKPIMERDPA
jgi:hypothetical protein